VGKAEKILGDDLAGIGQKVQVVMELYKREDLFGEVRRRSEVSVPQLQEVATWTSVVRDSRNVLHWGRSPAVRNDYAKTATLLLGAAQATRSLESIRVASEAVGLPPSRRCFVFCLPGRERSRQLELALRRRGRCEGSSEGAEGGGRGAQPSGPLPLPGGRKARLASISSGRGAGRQRPRRRSADGGGRGRHLWRRVIQSSGRLTLRRCGK
jgi:hypothetical protein